METEKSLGGLSVARSVVIGALARVINSINASLDKSKLPATKSSEARGFGILRCGEIF